MKQVNMLIFLEERNGEYEYTQRYLVQADIPNTQKARDKFCEKVAKDWYNGHSYKDGNVHFFNNGEVAVRYSGHKVLTNEEFKIFSDHFYC